MINLALSLALTIATLLARHSTVNYQLDHRHITDPALRDTLSHSYVYSIVGRVVGNIVLSVVYVFLVPCAVARPTLGLPTRIWLGSAGIVALLALQATPYPVWWCARNNSCRPQHNHTFWSFDAQSQAHEGRWAQGKTLIGDDDIVYLAEPIALGGDDAMIPPPDPNLFATYDGAMGKPKSGDATGARKQGAHNVIEKVKEKFT